MVCLQMFNQIACVKQSTFLSAPRHRSSADLTLCLTPVVVIYLKMSPNRRYGSTTELLIANEMLAAKFSETCILKYFDTMTNFPNTVKTSSKCNTRRQISYLLVWQRVVGQVGQIILTKTKREFLVQKRFIDDNAEANFTNIMRSYEPYSYD